MLSPGARKLSLSVHLTVSIGWIGAVVAYLGLDIFLDAVGTCAITASARYDGSGLSEERVVLVVLILEQGHPLGAGSVEDDRHLVAGLVEFARNLQRVHHSSEIRRRLRACQD